MRVVFMGTPEFAVPTLEALARRHEVTLVITRPDAVRKRGKRLDPSPVKACAVELGLPVLEATRIRADELAAIDAAQADACVVAAFGAILPDALLERFPGTCVNVHGSLLPRWRGAAPIQRAILAGDERVGISIMEVVHELDAGAYCRQASVEVGEKGCGEVMAELAELGAAELVAALDDIASGTIEWVEQDESLVTFSPKVEKGEMRLSPADAAIANMRRVQASTDAAPARTTVAGKGLRVTAARVPRDLSDGDVPAMGALVVSGGRVLLGCADSTLELVRVKPDGKREMEAGAWALGLHAKELAWGDA